MRLDPSAIAVSLGGLRLLQRLYQREDVYRVGFFVEFIQISDIDINLFTFVLRNIDNLAIWVCCESFMCPMAFSAAAFRLCASLVISVVMLHAPV